MSVNMESIVEADINQLKLVFLKFIDKIDSMTSIF